MTLATPHQPSHNSHALVNPSAGRENPIAQADSRHNAAFFASVHRYWCAFSMAGRSRASFGWAGSLCAGFSPLLRACHPRREKRLAGIQTAQEATMPRLSLRAPRAHLSVHPVPEKATTALIKQSKSSNANGIGIPFALRQMSMVDITRYQPIGRQIMITSKSILAQIEQAWFSINHTTQQQEGAHS
ncbi:ash family protein [Chromobacterium violaceum]|nr:ash family protein [Chromobacterium violaceum]